MDADLLILSCVTVHREPYRLLGIVILQHAAATEINSIQKMKWNPSTMLNIQLLTEIYHN